MLLPFLALVLASACSQTLDLGDVRDGELAPDAATFDSGKVDIPDAEELPVERVDPLFAVTSLSMGHNHGCAVANGGELYCWGANASGQLGLGDGTSRNFATRVGDASDWNVVRVGNDVTCATKSDGSLYCWGDGELGKLGLGDERSRTTPTKVEIPGPIVQLEANNYHLCAINELADLYCWGANLESNIGQGTNRQTGVSFYDVPQLVTTPNETGWIDVDVGDGHTCGIRQDLVMMCWGRNSNGQSGVVGPEQVLEPTEVPSPEGSWKEVRLGTYNTCGRTDRAWYCWGSAGSGKLPGSDEDVPLPLEMETLGLSDEVIAAAFHLCAQSATGTTTCWGRNLDSMLQAERIGEVIEPIAVGVELGPHKDVALGRFTTCVVDSGGGAWCRGENGGGRLGAGVPEADTAVFVPVGTRLDE